MAGAGFHNSLPTGQELEQLFSDVPCTELPLHLLAVGELTVGELAVRAGAVPSTCTLFVVCTGDELVRFGVVNTTFVCTVNEL